MMLSKPTCSLLASMALTSENNLTESLHKDWDVLTYDTEQPTGNSSCCNCAKNNQPKQASSVPPCVPFQERLDWAHDRRRRHFGDVEIDDLGTSA